MRGGSLPLHIMGVAEVARVDFMRGGDARCLFEDSVLLYLEAPRAFSKPQ